MEKQRKKGGVFADVVESYDPTAERIVFLPPLALVLAQREREAGCSLSESDVLSIRDRSPCIAMEKEDADAFEKVRGRDLDADNVWANWQSVRSELKNPD